MNNIAGNSGLVDTVTSTFGVMRLGAATTDSLDPTSLDSVMEEWQKNSAMQLGDKVNFSDEARAKAKAFAGPRDVNKGGKAEGTEEEEDPMVQSTKDRIKEIQKEIEEVEQSDLPEKEKQQQIAMLTQELTVQTQMLEKIQKASTEMNNRYGKGGLTFNMSSNIG